MPTARRAGQDDRAAACSCAVIYAARTTGTCAPSCPRHAQHARHAQRAATRVTALVSRLRILGEVLTSRSADAGRHPEQSPPADSGTRNGGSRRRGWSRTSSTRLTR